MEDVLDFECPYCGEPNGLTVDFSGGMDQDFIVDCEVCCKPVHLRLRLQADEEEEETGLVELQVRRDDEA